MDPRAEPLFEKARSLPAEQRRAFLARVCDGEPALLAEVEALLRAAAPNDASPAAVDPPAPPQKVVRSASPPPPVPPASPAQPGSALEQPGQLLGRYKLLQQIGEGGFGSVWMAEQREPVKRRVALKVLKLGMDSKQVLARFEAERQALAMMDHPNIARVFDAGCTERGRPYFVMEYIRGVPILEYCDTEKLDTRRRLELFVPVCNAIQHAHQKGIIHRDIKPSNVLVMLHDGVPVPKVIDFGVAKATIGDLTDKTLFTEHRQLIGTPAYMSPEQAEMSGLDVDTRSDIYSLGVLLYELLTGTTPFASEELLTKGIAEMVRVIREEEPQKPSTRVHTLARTTTPTALQRREPDERRLGQLLRGDLDWIVMKCLEKDRTRRYDTANGLAIDIQRHLTDQPVLAGPPGARYRLRKFVRRHRGRVFAGVAVLLALVLGMVGTTFGLLRALDEKERADEEARRATSAASAEQLARIEAQDNADKARKAEADAKERARELAQVAEFHSDQLSGLDPEQMGSRLRTEFLAKVRTKWAAGGLEAQQVDARMAEAEQLVAGIDFTGMAVHSLETNVLQRAFAAITSRFGDQPLVRARLEQSLADACVDLGLWSTAEAAQAEALAIRRKVLGDDDPATISSLRSMARLGYQRADFDSAERDAREALERCRRVLGPEDHETVQAMQVLSNILGARSKPEECTRLIQDAMRIAERTLGAEDPTTVSIMVQVATVAIDAGRLEEARQLLLRVLAISERDQGEEGASTRNALGWLVVVEQRLEHFDAAERYARRSLEIGRRKLGDDHRNTLVTLNNLGWMLCAAGRLEEAERFLKEALEGRLRVLGEDHQHTLASMRNLAVVKLEQGKLAEAEPLARDAVDRMHRVLGPDHMDTFWALGTLGKVLQAQKRGDEAEPPLRQAAEGYRRLFGADHGITLAVLRDLTKVLVDLGRRDDALALVRRLLEEAATPTAGRLAKAFLRDECAGVDQGNCDHYWRYLDVLASAERACNEFAAAVATRTQALVLLPDDASERAVIEQRLREDRAAAER